MIRKTATYLLSLLTLLMVSSFGDGTSVDIPQKKISKAIEKVWKTEIFDMGLANEINSKLCFNEGRVFQINSEDSSLGLLYVGRVNSCRSGGCSIDRDDEALAFEFFDYFFIADLQGEVKLVKIYNYQATQGHEVMSKGWLNQFKGLDPDTELVLGKDIETISGATVSAGALTADIQRVLQCMTNS